MLRLVFQLWALALLLKMLGASWDVSWHFKWLRDDLAPPHILNTLGTLLAIALVVFHSYTGFGMDKIALRLVQYGIGIFLIAIPTDLLNHRINGLDITSWSFSHALLYLGTATMIAGVIRAFWLYSSGTPLAVAFWLFFLENVLFPNQQQEYGVLSIAAWDRGRPYAEPSLLEFAANQIGRPVDRSAVLHFALPIPDWVYPTWATVAGMFVLVCARHLLGRRWTATAVAGAYVGYRMVMWWLLTGTHFPPSTVPFALLAGALAVDAAFALPRFFQPVIGAALVSTAMYGGLWLQSNLLEAPPIDYGSFGAAAIFLGLLWGGCSLLWGGFRAGAKSDDYGRDAVSKAGISSLLP
jgi:hypothetical protein